MKQKTKGILCSISAAFFFALMGLCVRLAGDIPSMQKSFFRNLVALGVAAVMLLKEQEKVEIKKGDWKFLIMRAFFGTIGIFCNFYAVDHLVLSDASMLNKLSPFFSIMFAYILLKERVNLVQGIAVITAFIGALFIIKPSGNFTNFPALIGMLGGLGAGIAYTMVRILGKRGVKGTFVIFFFSAFSCLASIPFMLGSNFTPMSVKQVLFLLGAGAAATGGQFSITKAYYCAPAKELSVYDYSQIVFSALMGLIVLGQTPDLYSFIGYFIICATAVGMYLYHVKVVKEA